MLPILETKKVKIYDPMTCKMALKTKNICLYKGHKIVNNGLYFYYNDKTNTVSKRIVRF